MLTEVELRGTGGIREQLVSKLRRSYGFSMEETEQELEQFLSQLSRLRESH
jgi:hypothetical protein